VLSACVTGRWYVAGDEGVIGLQPTFHKAEARRVVASLWKVDDEATRALMGRFYLFLWRDRLDPMQALDAAQLELLRGGSDEGTSRGLGRPAPIAASPRRCLAMGLLRALVA
jgi:CHAT domain-containing protein